MKNTLQPIFTPFAHVPFWHKVSVAIFWLICLFIAWGNASVLLPTPQVVASELISFFSDSEFYLDLLSSVLLTMKAMLLSIVIASILTYLSTIGFVRPLVQTLIKIRYMSLMGFFFVFMLMFKDGSSVKLVFLMYGIIPFFSLSLISIINRIQSKEYDLWTTLKYSKWEQVYEIIIYGKLDYLLETIRANFAMGWLMITMVESFSMAEGGLGVLLFKYNKYNQLDKIFALQIIIFALGATFDYLLQKLRYACFPHVALTEKAN